MTPGPGELSVGSRQQLRFCSPPCLAGGAPSVLAEGVWEWGSSGGGGLAPVTRRPAAWAEPARPPSPHVALLRAFPVSGGPLGIARLGVSHQGPGWSVECGASLRPRTLKPLGQGPGRPPPHPAQPQPLPQEHLTCHPPTHVVSSETAWQTRPFLSVPRYQVRQRAMQGAGGPRGAPYRCVMSSCHVPGASRSSLGDTHLGAA